MWPRRKPVTHALALWILVGAGAAALVGLIVFMSVVSNIRKGGSTVFPPRHPVPAEQLPSLFGVVTAIGPTSLFVDSKQSFNEIIVEEDTRVTTVGGAAMAASDIKIGAVITATGRDLGDKRLMAVAIVVLENGTGTAPPPMAPAEPLTGARFLDAWKELPTLAGWNASFAAGEPVAAAREFDFGGFGPDAKPAASYLLFNANGSIAERIELDVEGLVRRKPLNPFMTPEEAEREIERRGLTVETPIVAQRRFLTASGRAVEIELPNLEKKTGVMLVDGTRRIEIIPFNKITSAKSAEADTGLGGSFWLSPDKRFLLASIGVGIGITPASIHLVDLKKFGIE